MEIDSNVQEKNDLREIDNDWNSIVDSRMKSGSTVKEDKEGEDVVEEESDEHQHKDQQQLGRDKDHDPIEIVLSQLQKDKSTMDKNLIMSWFWAGYYQGERNAVEKYEHTIASLKEEMAALRKGT